MDSLDSMDGWYSQGYLHAFSLYTSETDSASTLRGFVPRYRHLNALRAKGWGDTVHFTAHS